MRLTTLVTAVLFATGCMGGIEETGTPNPTNPDAPPPAAGAKALYTGSVHSVVLAKCSGSGCHAQSGVTGIYGFAVTDAEASYTQVTSLPTLVGTYSADSRILTKIDGTHYAITYSADDKSKISAWLAAELSERNANGMPPVDPVQRLAQWSGCMSLDNFTTSNMPTAWGNLAANNLQKCANCHAGGAYAFMSGNGNAEIFFNTITSQKDLLLKYFTVDATGAIIINEAAFKNAGVDLPPDTDHPEFNPTTNAGMTALTEFYNLTKTRQLMNLCDPPRLPPT
ncbi:MAG: hypothetical protein SFX73_17470 [Kofleriaceae bacterium]|nr:hypothetical protein [Kofleriaceae bacterium]